MAFSCPCTAPANMRRPRNHIYSPRASLPAAPASDELPMTYQAITVTPEDSEEVVVQKDKGGARTSFNVTVAGKRQCAVPMRGEARLESGMVVTAVLRDTENWQTLVGWLNQATGEIYGVDSPAKSFWSFVTVLPISALFPSRWPEETVSGRHGATGITVWILAALVMSAWLLFSWRKSATVYRLLRPWERRPHEAGVFLQLC